MEERCKFICKLESLKHLKYYFVILHRYITYLQEESDDFFLLPRVDSFVHNTMTVIVKPYYYGNKKEI